MLLGDNTMGNFKSRQRQRSNAEFKMPVRVPSTEGIEEKHTDDIERVTPSPTCIEEPDSAVQPKVCLVI